ncbi:8201_t:CDS:2, partial [Racocetra persica]
ELAICETPEKQRWRHADAPIVENKAKGLVKYLPKLSPLLDSLNDYSQIEKVGDSVFYVSMKKTKKKVLSDNEINFYNSGIQVSLSEHSCDFGIQVSLPNPEYESLIKKINELEHLNQQLLLENNLLKKKLNNKYDNQQEHVKAVVEIAKRKQIALYDDLHNYLSSIITELYTEKNEEINVIDDLITNQSAKTKNQKQCYDCSKKDIENSKCKCPQCHAKLPILAETQQEKEQTISDKKEKDSIKLLTFRPYQPKESKSGKSDESTSSISITQNLEPQDGVKIPDVFVPDSLPINPNSVDNVRKIFDYIQNISRVNNGNQRWIVVVCDRLPYHYAQKFKSEYSRIILLPGPLHEKINMLKAFVELNW